MTSHGRMTPSSNVKSVQNKRHKVVVTQFICIMALYVISFLPLVLLINNPSLPRFVGYIYFINHVGNFFIYLAVNSEFRKQVKQLALKITRRDGAAMMFMMS